MGKQVDKSPDEVSDDRLQWLEDQMALIEDAYSKAIEAPSYQAAAAFAREVRFLRDQYDGELAERARLAALARDTDATRDTTDPEVWLSMVREDAQASTLDELEIYVHEWLSQTGHRLVVEGDELRLTRVA